MKEQIEKMANDIEKSHWKIVQDFMGCHINSEEMAEHLYNAGYRKQSEGEWEFEFTLDGDDFYKCSVCGRQEVLNDLSNERNPAKHYPYCHCGAKMKGGAE